MNKLAANYKALSSLISNIVLVGTSVVSLLELVPADYKWAAQLVSILLVGIGLLGSAHVWLVKNETLVTTAVNEVTLAGNIVKELKSIFHGAGSVVAAAPTVPAAAAPVVDVAKAVVAEVAAPAVKAVVTGVAAPVAQVAKTVESAVNQTADVVSHLPVAGAFVAPVVAAVAEPITEAAGLVADVASVLALHKIR